MQQSKMAFTGQPIKVFNNGNMPVPWNAKQIPPGVRDFTYIDDIVEGVVRVIDNPPSREIREANISQGAVGAQNNIAAQISPPQLGEPVPGTREVASPTGEDGVVNTPDNEKPINQTPAPPAREIRGANISHVPYKVYNIGNSSPVQLMEYISAIEKTLGREAKKEFLPMQPGDVPRTEADVTDLVENLGYKPDTPVHKGIEKFIKWYKQYFSQL